MKLIVTILLTICIPFNIILAQSTIFGKNKVQYSHFEWSYIQSHHFDIYFTQGGKNLAEFTADVAESAYKSIEKSFKYQITNRIPIIVYNSHNDFQQTNVVSALLGEGVGGVTELFKNRIVVPFEGDYRKFRHVIHHELVHGVMNDMFYGGSIQSIIANNITLQLPLWFSEGLAEYESLKWDSNSDMFLRDATVNNYLPEIKYLDGYLAYRGGQSVWNYIAMKYGEEKISTILMQVKATRSVEQGFRNAIGIGVEELSERWQKEQKVLYWPDVAKRLHPSDYARLLTDHKKDGSFYNTSPAISPRGDRLAFISNRDDYFDVFLMNTIDGTIQKKIIKGQRTVDFEELNLLTPGISWSPDGTRIAMAVKSGKNDAIFLINVDTGEQIKLEFDLDGIYSVDWSPNGHMLTFIGTSQGKSDVYFYDLSTSSLTNLTNDIFSESDPSWSADCKSIYFSSDRNGYIVAPSDFRIQDYNNMHFDVYRIDITTREIVQITNFSESDETSPIESPDGKKLLFISDLNGINNIYVKDITSDSIYPITNSISGIYQLSLSRDGNKLAFASLYNGGFNLFLMLTPLEREPIAQRLEPTEYLQKRKIQKVSQKPRQVGDEGFFISENVYIRTNIYDTTNIVESQPKADYRNYIFGSDFAERFIKDIDTTDKFSLFDNVNEGGEYKVNKYKITFSPDIIYGNAGFNTYYGIHGSTIMAFSDMLGDHQIYFLTNLVLDLKNSDYAAAYLYLPKRIDYGIEGFHSARFLFLKDTLYRFRNYGVNGMASYPINKFKRIEFGLSWLNIKRDNLDFSELSSVHRVIYLPSLRFVYDTVLWGLISPSNGVRYNLGVLTSPKLSSQSLGFYTITGDYRRYFRLGKNYSLAMRFAGGGSFGENPQRFIVGGVDDWINRQFTNDELPFESTEDFVFLTAGVPLRGYIYNSKSGTKYALMNLEFRFPFFGYLAAGSLPPFLHSFSGIFFFDVGSAWSSRKDLVAFTKDRTGSVYMKDLLTGMGYGIRFIVLGFLLKMDVAWAYNFQSFSKPKYYFSVGADF